MIDNINNSTTKIITVFAAKATQIVLSRQSFFLCSSDCALSQLSEKKFFTSNQGEIISPIYNTNLLSCTRV